MTSQLELRFSCQKLKNLDFLSKSDPVIQIFQQKNVNGKKSLEFVGQTEIINDNLSPEFKEPIIVDYYFQEQQFLLLRVLDVDSTVDASTAGGSCTNSPGFYQNKPNPMAGNKVKTFKISKADTIGETVISLAELASSPGMVLQRKLQLPNSTSTAFRGAITVRGEEVDGNPFDNKVNLNFANVNVSDLATKKPLFGLLPCLPGPEPRIWVCKTTETGHEVVVFKSEILQRSPYADKRLTAKNFEISLREICNNDRHRPLKFKIFDEKDPDRPKLMCETQTTVNEIFSQMENDGVKKAGVELRLFDAKHKSSTKPPTKITFQISELHMPSFLDFVRGGLGLNLHVGIDFTASNGDPKLDPNSLHFIGNGSHMMQNQYERVLSAVSAILREYDSDKIIPAYGFGAKVVDMTSQSMGGNNFNPQTQNFKPVSHCFPLNVLENKAECIDIAGLLQTYKHSCLPYVKLSGPTLFAPLLKTILDNSARREMALGGGLNDYHIVLILTDGVIHDMRDTVREIVDSSNLPVSVIIVGIGNADFRDMETLDADNGALTCSVTGRRQARDQVQFVPFNTCGGSGARLQNEVLKELPQQVCDYFKMRNVVPGVPRVPTGIVGGAPGNGNVNHGTAGVKNSTNTMPGASAPPMMEASNTADFSNIPTGYDPATVYQSQGSVVLPSAPVLLTTGYDSTQSKQIRGVMPTVNEQTVIY